VGAGDYISRHHYRRRKNLISECRDENFRSSVHRSIQWPTAGRPNHTCWKEWQQALDTCFLRPDDRHERLNRPLGSWTKLPNKWQWHFDQEQDILYEYHSHQTWTQWRQNEGRGPTQHQGFRRSGHAVANLPAEAFPTTVYGQDIKRPQGTKHILPHTAVSPENGGMKSSTPPPQHSTTTRRNQKRNSRLGHRRLI
jgi:hypothetical protein